MRTQAAFYRLSAMVSILAVTSALAEPAKKPTYHAAPDEVAQLPKFCYSQYVDGALGGYEFGIPSDSCGHAMNHFCPALVLIIQAQKQSIPRNERVGSIRSAVREIDYTIREMKPGCFITRDVLQAKERAQILSRFIK